MRPIILFTTLLALVLTRPAMAQYEAEMTRPIGDDLNISDQQREALKEIHRTYGVDIRAARADESLSDADRVWTIAGLKTDRDEDVAEVLGEEAFADYLAARDALRARGRERHAQLVLALELNDGQAEAMREIHEKYHELHLEIRDSGLMDAEKQEARKTLRTQKDDEIREVLTEDQYEVFETERKKRRLRMRMKRIHGSKPTPDPGPVPGRSKTAPGRLDGGLCD